MQSLDEKASADILFSSRKRQDNSNITENQNNCSISSSKVIEKSNANGPTIKNAIDGSSCSSRDNASNSNSSIISSSSNIQSHTAEESLRHLKSILLLNPSTNICQQTISKTQSIALLKECLIGTNSEQNNQIPNIKFTIQSSSKIVTKSAVPSSPAVVINPERSVTKEICKSSTKYASSKLLMSPEPVSIPMPDFDESFYT